MPRTPDRFPGGREDEELTLEDQGPGGLNGGDPTVPGNLRYVTNQFKFRDGLGVFNSRSVYATNTAPTATDDGASGYTQGLLWLNTATGIIYLSQDASTSAAVWTALNLRKLAVEFTLAEDVYNTPVYFTAWRDAAGDSPGSKRSSISTGLAEPITCSPYQVPFDATVVGATLTLKGAGVQDPSVTYPVTYQTDLFSVGFTSESKIADIDFSISASFTVGSFEVGNTHFQGEAPEMSLNVTKGQMLGLKFTPGEGPDLVGLTRNAFVSLLLQERP